MVEESEGNLGKEKGRTVIENVEESKESHKLRSKRQKKGKDHGGFNWLTSENPF